MTHCLRQHHFIPEPISLTPFCSVSDRIHWSRHVIVAPLSQRRLNLISRQTRETQRNRCHRYPWDRWKNAEMEGFNGRGRECEWFVILPHALWSPSLMNSPLLVTVLLLCVPVVCCSLVIDLSSMVMLLSDFVFRLTKIWRSDKRRVHPSHRHWYRVERSDSTAICRA